MAEHFKWAGSHNYFMLLCPRDKSLFDEISLEVSKLTAQKLTAVAKISLWKLKVDDADNNNRWKNCKVISKNSADKISSITVRQAEQNSFRILNFRAGFEQNWRKVRRNQQHKRCKLIHNRKLQPLESPRTALYKCNLFNMADSYAAVPSRISLPRQEFNFSRKRDFYEHYTKAKYAKLSIFKTTRDNKLIRYSAGYRLYVMCNEATVPYSESTIIFHID